MNKKDNNKKIDLLPEIIYKVYGEEYAHELDIKAFYLDKNKMHYYDKNNHKIFYKIDYKSDPNKIFSDIDIYTDLEQAIREGIKYTNLYMRFINKFIDSANVIRKEQGLTPMYNVVKLIK